MAACPGQQLRRDGALRPRKQPEKHEPEHHQYEAGDLQLPIRVDDAADRRRRGTEQHEDDREARMNGRLATTTLRAARGSPRRLGSTAEIAER